MASLGSSNNKPALPSGLSFELGPHNWSRKGTLILFADRGVPIVHLLRILSLGRSHCLPIAPDYLALPGEGAVALVLKRRRDAERDGDRIYATVRGLGSATGGRCDSTVPTEDAYRRALANAYDDAGVDPMSVGFVETHGSGHPPEDRVEAQALSAWFHGTRSTVLGSAKADVGHTDHGDVHHVAVSVDDVVVAFQHWVLPFADPSGYISGSCENRAGAPPSNHRYLQCS